MAIAPVVFTPGTMPRMYVMDALSQRWLHRDVSGITQPLITWNLNAPDTFTCTFAPPRPDLLDSTGNPLFNEWQHACFLEQGNDILFGGILLSSQITGNQWTTTWQGYGGYPNGMPYEGPVYTHTNLEALDAVRYIWYWLQTQPEGNIHVWAGTPETGVLLGAQPQATPAQTTLLGDVDKGNTLIHVRDVAAHGAYPAFATGMLIQFGGGAGEQHTIRSINKRHRYFTLASKIRLPRHDGIPVKQVVPLNPFVLDWRNSTDCGQEIQSIQQEAVFDWTERHYWTDSGKQVLNHTIDFQIPRRGTRRTELRFVEGENLAQSTQTTRDGVAYANNVVGLGAGQGRNMVRVNAGERDGRIRRVHVYQDQTVKNTPRMVSKAHRVLRSVINIDTPTSAVVRNHRNAPFGSFHVGDDILVSQNTGWQNRSTWCRITAMAQDPSTNLISLTLVRSDSYTYMAQSGQAGTI